MYETTMSNTVKTMIKLAAEQTRDAMQSKFVPNDQIGKSNLVEMAKSQIADVKKDLETDLANLLPEEAKFLSPVYVIIYLQKWNHIENVGNSYKVL